MEFTANDEEIDIGIQCCAIREEVTNARNTDEYSEVCT